MNNIETKTKRVCNSDMVDSLRFIKENRPIMFVDKKRKFTFEDILNQLEEHPTNKKTDFVFFERGLHDG